MNARETALLVSIVLLGSCENPTTPPPPPPPPLETPVGSVQLDRDSVFLQQGATLQLEATVRDTAGRVLDRTVSWTSSNVGAASVTPSGLVTTHAGGLARVVAAAGGKSDTAVVRVPGAVATVELDLDTLHALEGSTRQFTATARDADGYVITGRAVIWSSSDPDIAEVGGLGLVTALRPGTVEVRARVDGDTGRAVVIVRSEYDFDLVFPGWSGTAGEWPRLYMVDPNDSSRVANGLSATLGAVDFAVAPDGSQYVVAGIVGNVRGLYRVNRDGSNPTLLLADSAASQPAWSPDGTKIAFRRWPIGEGADIWIMNTDGSDLVNLTADHGATSQHTPAFSPLLPGGGYRLAYAHSPGPTAHIWTMDPDGSDKTQVTSGDVWDDSPAWSPDGAKLVYQRTGDIWVVQASGGAPWSLVTLPFGQFAPQWSPDGALVAFATKAGSGHFEIFTVRVSPAGVNVGGLTQRTADALDKQEPAWVPRN